MKKVTIIQIIAVAIIILVPVLLMAQASPPSSNPFNSSSSDPDSAPIDGGLSLLMVACAGYGAKKMKEKRQPLAPKGLI